MSGDRLEGGDELRRFYDRQRRQILQRADAEQPMRQADVERFYARQRAELLARVAGEGASEGRPARRPAAGWRLYGALAAAAALAVVFAPVLLREPAPPFVPREDGLVQILLEESAGQDEALPLLPFGPWGGELEAVEPLGHSHDDSFTSLSWLLEGEAAEEESENHPLPAFLQPYGLWSEPAADDPGGTMETSA